jgi:hypothetical protein
MRNRHPQCAQTAKHWSRLMRTVFLMVFTITRRLARTAWQRCHRCSLMRGSCCPSKILGDVERKLSLLDVQSSHGSDLPGIEGKQVV